MQAGRRFELTDPNRLGGSELPFRGQVAPQCAPERIASANLVFKRLRIWPRLDVKQA